MTRRRVNLLVVPEQGGQIRQFRVPLWPVYALVAIAVLFSIFVVGSGAAYWRMLRAERHNARLYHENETLRAELVSLGGRINGLDEAMRSHIRLANDTRLLAGLSPYGEEEALLGVGGAAPARPTAEAAMSPPVSRTVEFYSDRLDQLLRQVSFQEASFVEVREIVEQNRARLDHIPTINPVQGRCSFSSGFGQRRDPFTGRRTFHSGLDLCATTGTPFCATADGVVLFAGPNGDLGNTVKVDHENGLATVYGHARSLRVRKGQRVRRGEALGEVGRSGRTTGVHLHYEVRQGDTPVNPSHYILDARR